MRVIMLNPRVYNSTNPASYEDATSMVTISEGKHFSLGLELELLTESSYSEFMKYMSDVQDLFRRLLTFPLVTVAAANGMFNAI